jgi:uncharacterized protein (DUF433 family)/DNA-binding transcriptional MerR regulator
VFLRALRRLPIMTIASPEKLLGIGLYSLGDAARLLRMPTSSVRYWILGRGGVQPLIKQRLSEEHLLTFAELIELHFVNTFRREGVSLQAIRKSAARAAKMFHAEYPFTAQRFDTDGRSIFATLVNEETNKVHIQDLKRGQLVFVKFIRPLFRKLEYRGAEIERFWPLRTSRSTGRIVLDPHRQFGQPIDAETGVSTSVLVSAVTAGEGQDVRAVAKWFEIPVEAVRAAVRFERSLAG